MLCTQALYEFVQNKYVRLCVRIWCTFFFCYIYVFELSCARARATETEKKKGQIAHAGTQGLWSRSSCMIIVLHTCMLCTQVLYRLHTCMLCTHIHVCYVHRCSTLLPLPPPASAFLSPNSAIRPARGEKKKHMFFSPDFKKMTMIPDFIVIFWKFRHYPSSWWTKNKKKKK